MNPNMRRGHDALWKRFFKPASNLIYDIDIADPDDLPTADEVRASIPNCAGWGTGMEDCCLTGGFVLAGLVTAHRVTGEREWADKARKVFRGLEALGSVSRTKGFVARGFAPGRSDIYPNSSADQYTAFEFGLWSYARSPIARKDERAAASRLVVDVARLVESFGHNIPREDMRPSIYGDTNTIEPGRACRILMFYKAAHELSGDSHWRERYLEKVEEDNRARLSCHYGPEAWPMDYNVHAVIQSQAAFRLLYECEADKAIREAYRKALRAEALSVIGRIPLWRQIVQQDMGTIVPGRWRDFWPPFIAERPDYDPSRHDDVKRWHQYGKEHAKDFPVAEGRGRRVLPWLRHQTQSLAVVMLCEEMELKRRAAEEGRAMLAEVDWTQVGHAGVWECLDLGYWLGVEAGAFPKD